MSRKMQRLFARRAEDLAFVHLTRRNDLVVNRLDAANAGVDFLVTVTRGGTPTGRVFGVQVKAREPPVMELDELVRTIRPRFARSPMRRSRSASSCSRCATITDTFRG